MNLSPQVMKPSTRICWVVLLWLLASTAVCAQSTDINAPSPVRTSEVVGRIAARDLGDARLTDHFFAFTGMPGDVLITIQSSNLNGDVDVFTAVNLKPLFKIALYAESATPITKGIYLRRREDLILRVQARSPNDDDGIYQLRFGGSFAPVIGGPEIGAGDTPAADMPAPATAGKKTRRVSSVGARIEEPAPAVSEVAAAPTPEPTPVETASVEPAKEKPAVVETPKPAPPRSARSRRPVGRRGTARATAKPKETATTKKTDTTEGENAEPGSKQPESESATKTATTAKSGRRATSESAAKSAEAPSEPEAESGPRLIIQTSAGTLINRPMSGVRRVTIENGQVFVVSKDGRTLRIPLANIAKMSIEP